MAWKITLTSGKVVSQGELTAAQYIAVSELLEGATWTTIEPTQGPRQLVSWLAVLEAQDTQNPDAMGVLVEVMNRPMTQVLACLQVD